MPNLKDETLKICYEALKIKTKPSLNFEKDKRLLAMDDGGTSFWSDKQHRWIRAILIKMVSSFRQIGLCRYFCHRHFHLSPPPPFPPELPPPFPPGTTAIST